MTDSGLFIVTAGDWPVAAFTTRELADAWATAANAQAVVNAGTPGLSCQTPEEAARTYWVEEATPRLPLDPVHEALESVEEQFVRHYGSRAAYNTWISGGPYYRDENGKFRDGGTDADA